MDKFSVTAILDTDPKIVRDYEFEGLDRDDAMRKGARSLVGELKLPFTATEAILHPLIRIQVRNLSRDARKKKVFDLAVLEQEVSNG